MSDITVVLPSGSHPDIKQDCCVVYEEAEIVKVSAIHAAIAGNALVQSVTSLPANLVADIQEGVFASEDTPIKVVGFCTDRT